LESNGVKITNNKYQISNKYQFSNAKDAQSLIQEATELKKIFSSILEKSK
jgi:hypothetical protein